MTKESKNLVFENLRSIVVIPVVITHAVIAYTSVGFKLGPVADKQVWDGFIPFLELNYLFLMTLMFFISGLFKWKSLLKTGKNQFIRKRLTRLGIPFLVLSIIQLTTWLLGIKIGISHPLWFVWMLLFFDLIVAFFHPSEKKTERLLQSNVTTFLSKPLAFFIALVLLSTLAYVPMAMKFGPSGWTLTWPFVFETSRIFVYFLYFLVGVIVGAYGIEKSIFKTEGNLSKYWWAWIIASLLAIYFVGPILYYGFPISSSILCLGVIAIFLRFMNRTNRFLHNLSKNAYGIYLTHFFYVTLTQKLLLDVQLSAIEKASIVVIVGLGLSWATTEALRHIPILKRIL